MWLDTTDKMTKSYLLPTAMVLLPAVIVSIVLPPCPLCQRWLLAAPGVSLVKG